MADKRISQLVERVSILNNDVLPIVASGAATTNKVTIQTIEDYLQNNLDFGVTSVGLTINTSGTDIAVTGSPITSTGSFTISIPTASATNRGALSSADWTTFNNKVSTTRSISTTAPLQGGGDLSANRTLSITQAGASSNGYLSSTDWNTFNNKQDALGYTPVNQTRQLTINGTSYDLSADRTWNVGTVTSVGISMPSAFSVASSPVTSSGTLTITGAGTASQYIDGTGALQPFPTIIGQAKELIREVYNESGATMAKGTVVYIDGGHGNLPTIAKALADSDATSAQTYGVVQDDILDMSNGYIVVVGDLVGLNTQAFTEGTQLYLSGTTAGAYTSTKPYAPIHLVYVGIVTRSHPQLGVIAVKIQNGYEMDEIHDVAAQNPSNNDILQYKTATGLWTKTAGTTTNIAEGTNLYYTDGRARAAISESVTGLDYDNTTGVLSTTTGYGIPTTAKQAEWDAAYNDKINSAAVTGTTTKTLTLTQQDGGTVTASWTDYDTAPVTSVFGRTGAIVATEGDYNLGQLGDVTITTPSNGQVLRYNGTAWVNDTGYVGTVTSVGLSAPTGFSVSGSPVTSSGTLALSFAAGYSLPTNASQTNWDAAYNDKINSAAVTGTTTKTLTLTQQDGGTITTSWTDINTDAVTSVFGRTGAVVATEGDYSLTQLSDVTITTPSNGQFLKYDGTSWINAAAGTVTSVALATGTTGTDVGVTGSPITGAGTITLNIPVASATNTGKLSSTDWSTFNGKEPAIAAGTTAQYWRGDKTWQNFNTAARGSISLTTTGTSGAATYDSATGVLNVPQYSTDLSGYVTLATAQTISGIKIFRNTGSDTLTIYGVDAAGTTGQGAAVYLGGNDGVQDRNYAAIYSRKENATSGNPAAQFVVGVRHATLGIRDALTIDSSRNVSIVGNVSAASIIKTGGTASQFLKADGSVDSSTYLTSSSLSNYVTLDTAQTISGGKIFSAVTQFSGTPTANNGGLISVRDNVTALNVTSFGGVFFNSSPGNDYSIGKLTENGVGFLQIRNANNGTEFVRFNSSGASSFASSVTINNALMVSGNLPNLLTVQNNAATNYTTAYIAQTVQGGNGNQNIGLLVDVQGASANDRIANFRYYNSGSPISVLSVTRGAGVGIYQQLPEAGLDVNTDVRIRSFLRVDSGINYTSGILNLTGASQQWCKMGTLSIGQGGHTCLITLVGGAGYNADEGQNGIAEIFLRTSNGSPSGAGWFISGWLNVRGFTTGFINGAVLVQNSSTSYDVYVQLGNYSGNTYYRIEGSSISWSASPSVYGATPPSPSLNLTNSFRVVSNSLFQSNLDAYGNITAGGHYSFNGSWQAGTVNKIRGYRDNDDKSIQWSFDNSPAGTLIKDNNSIQLRIGTNSALHVNSSRCIGLFGATPSGWGSPFANNAIEMNNGNSIFSYAAANVPAVYYTSNAYYDGSTYRSKVNAGAAMMYLDGNGAGFGMQLSNVVGQGDAITWTERIIGNMSGITMPTNLRIGGVMTIGGDTNSYQVTSVDYTFSAGWREIFRTNSIGLCTSGRFSFNGTGNSFVHSSQWAWSSTHNGGTGRARLIQLTGGEYSDISFAIDTTTGGNVIISVNIPGYVAGVGMNICVEKTRGTAINFSNQNADRTNPDAGYSRVQTITSIPYGSQVYKLVAENDVVAYSDAKLKTNVKTIDNALNKVLALRGVSYNRIDIEQDINRIGVIAQEVQEVLPEVVTNSGDTLGVSYGNMVGVLIEAMKEQQKQIEELKNLVNASTK